MAGPTLGPPLLLHLGLEDVPRPLLQLIAGPTLVLAENRPVAVVELLDDLKRPAPVEYVPADHVGLQPVGDGWVPGSAKLVGRLAKEQVGMPHELMKLIQMPPGAFDVFQRLGQRTHRLDRLVADPVGPTVEAATRL